MKKIQHKAFVVILSLLLVGCTYTYTPGGFVVEADGEIVYACRGTKEVTDLSIRAKEVSDIIEVLITAGIVK